MLIIISPAKSLDYTTDLPFEIHSSRPRLHPNSLELVSILKEFKPEDLMKLMDISHDLAQINFQRYKSFSTRYTPKNSKPALYAFDGDVYLGLDAYSLSHEEALYANDHLRILSGLYGLLSPFDMLQPYRLEMGTKLPNPKGNNLYQYWGDTITKLLNKDLQKSKDSYVVNLASEEYGKAVQWSKLKKPVINIHFKEEHLGKLRFVSFNAKKARGMMSRFIIQNQVKDLETLKNFSEGGYLLNEEGSTARDLLFVKGL